MAFTATFWGVRGTIPCPSSTHMRFGGNTSCVEVTAGEHTIILDCGTGFRSLGKDLMSRDTRRATILLSHFHLDHIAGFPFFQPAYKPDFSFRIMAGRFNACPDIRAILATQMDPPLFPVPMRTMRADMTFEDFRPADTLTLDGGLTVRTAVLNHPDGACGYRIDYDGRSLAYVTDTEHVPGAPDRNILELIDGADLVIYDATYTEREFACKPAGDIPPGSKGSSFAGWRVPAGWLCSTTNPTMTTLTWRPSKRRRSPSGHPSSPPARGKPSPWGDYFTWGDLPCLDEAGRPVAARDDPDHVRRCQHLSGHGARRGSPLAVGDHHFTAGRQALVGEPLIGRHLLGNALDRHRIAGGLAHPKEDADSHPALGQGTGSGCGRQLPHILPFLSVRAIRVARP